MVNEELIAFVRAQVEHGASREDIMHILKTKGGWTDEDVLGAFAMVGGGGLSAKNNLSNDKKDEAEEPIFHKEKNDVVDVVEKKEDDDISILDQAKVHEENKKGSPFKIILIVIILVALGIGGFFAYSNFATQTDTVEIEEFVEEKTENLPIAKPEEVVADGLIEKDGVYYVQGQLILPEGIVEKPITIMNTSATSELFPIMTDGMFEVVVLPNQMNVIAAMLPDKEFGFMKVVGPSDFKNDPLVLIDAHSSAVAFVFLSPYLISEDVELAEPILFSIRKNEIVKDFAEVIIEKSVTTTIPLDDEEYTEAFSNAIESVLEDLNFMEEEKETKG